jgi:REP element-mobilizing transposase RayT
MFVDFVGWLNLPPDFSPSCCTGNFEFGFKPEEKAYGGSLMTKRKGRQFPRPLAVKSSMHLVLRSTHAKGKWRFQATRDKWKPIINKFSVKYGVKILSLADPGNHIHLHIQLSNRHAYRRFIRAVTAAIAMAITGTSRWKKIDFKFWDRRPFTRVVVGRRGYLNASDYVRVNLLESQGYDRETARDGVRNYRASVGNSA